MANVVCEISVTQAPLAARVNDIAGAGAVVDFWGVVRPIEDGREIEGIDYEAHREMAEHQLKRIAEQAEERFRLKLVIVHHRIGFIAVGEASLFLRVASPHRSEGFRASQWIVDELKKKVPIWKRPRFRAAAASLMPDLAVKVPNVPHEDRDRRSRLQYELGEPTYSEPAGVDGALCSVAQFVLALCAHRRTRDFSDCRSHRFHRWRDRTALRSHHELRQIDGSAGGQNHGGGGVHFTCSFESSAGMGGNNRCGARFSDHGSAANGERQGTNSAGRKPRQTKDVVANRYHHFFSRPPVDCGTPLRDMRRPRGGCGRGAKPVPCWSGLLLP